MSVQLFRFGIDYLRYNLCADFSPNHFAYLFIGLSENSKQKFEVQFLGYAFTSINYIETRQHLILQFYHGPYHVLTLVKHMDMGMIRSMSFSLTFEGTFFAIPELLPFLVTFTKRFLNSLSVSRIDIALDCSVKTEVLWKWKRTQFRFNEVIRDRGYIETFYLGKKIGNKKYFIRVYDKKIDSMNKGKYALFHHYLSKDIVTRIEAEVHTITAKVLGITPQVLLEYVQACIAGEEDGLKPLEQWFASLCINEQGTCFYSLRGLALSQSTKLTTAKFTGRSEAIERGRYVRTMLAYATRLHHDGFDVIGYLSEKLVPLNGTSSKSSNCPAQPASDTLNSQ